MSTSKRAGGRGRDRSLKLRLDHLPRREPTPFERTFNRDDRAHVSKGLELLKLDRLSIEGQLVPQGHDDWHLEAKLKARVEQACVVTSEPVRTAINEEITRRYLAEVTPPELGEREVEDGDEEIEELPRVVDLADLVREELALALPEWPRSPEADSDEWQEILADEPPDDTESQETVRPFAGLAALRENPPDSAPDPGPEPPAPPEDKKKNN